MNTDAGDVELAVRGVSKVFGTTSALDGVDLVVQRGSVVALLGPSGCGKTTLLRTIAGLEDPDAGTITVAGKVLTDGPSVVPPEKRRIGMVFQDWALFPHLSVAANVGYGLPKAERRGPRVAEALDLVGLGGFGGRAPGTLSGGQQQRVALARALAPRPSLLLLDEPFSNLDASLRVEVRSEIHALLLDLGITCVFVTHDQDEAFVVGDEVAVMRAGRVVQHGRPQAVYDEPVDEWVATFVGDANLLPGTASVGGVTTAFGSVHPRGGTLDEGRCTVVVRPEHVHLVSSGASGTIQRVESYGHDCLVFVALDDGATIQARETGASRWSRGERVGVELADVPMTVFPSTSA